MSARDRRYRQRKREGLLLISLLLDETARLDLVDDGYLDWGLMDDKAAVAEAVIAWMRATRRA